MHLRNTIGAALVAAAGILAAPGAQADEWRGGFNLQFGSPYPPPPPRYYQAVPVAPSYYGCHPIHTWSRDWHGRPVRVHATECFDAYGRPFVLGGSERVIGRY
jgi:hypothetical protein